MSQTRVYYHDRASDAWFPGRVLERCDSLYRVQLPNRRVIEVDTEDLYVRWNQPIEDPTPMLAYQLTETPFFHKYRNPLVCSMVRQRADSSGIPALLSSAIEIVPYQVRTIQRVLQDPIQRYLLGDEVGLGKTIVASTIIRQHVLDQPTRCCVLIIVPRQLVHQWRGELCDKFYLEHHLDRRIRLVSHDNYTELEKEARKELTMVVIDEAHHLSSLAWSSEEGRRQFDLFRVMARNTPKLLLLSATPVLNNEDGFLAMLHLLDPVVYPLENRNAFNQRVRDRQDIAELVGNLDVERSPYDLVQYANQIGHLLPNDLPLQTLLNTFSSHVSEDDDDIGEEGRQAIDAIRVHVSELYRLHRRLLRTRRADAQPYVSEQRAGVAVIDVRAGIDFRLEELLDWWRVEVSTWLYNRDSTERHPFEELYWALLQASWSDLRIIRAALRARVQEEGTEIYSLGCRFLGELAQRIPLFDGEEEIIFEILRQFPSSEQEPPRVQALLQFLDERIRANPQEKLIIFADQPCTADQIFHALEVHLSSRSIRHTLEDLGWRSYFNDPTISILVCDQRAEEGLNLQSKRVTLVHYDLLLEPNRMEQRMGRVDRFGTNRPLPSIVLVEDKASMQRMWLRCLDEGFGVFSRSVSTLQYVIEQEMNAARCRIVDEGNEAFESLVERLRGKQGVIQQELRQIQMQDQLDSNYLSEEILNDETFDDEPIPKEMMDGWLLCALLFRSLDEGEEIVRYRYSDLRTNSPTLIPADRFTEFFQHALDRSRQDGYDSYPLGFRRQAIINHQGRYPAVPHHMACIGEPFVDSLYRYLRWDDRGMCFALWRFVSDKAHTSPTMPYFRFDFVVETDIEKARDMILCNENFSIESISRRADSLFPPYTHTLWLDVYLEPVTDQSLLTWLNYPYHDNRRNTPAGYNDYNLNPNRWRVVRELNEDDYEHLSQCGHLESWREHVQYARAIAQQRLQEDTNLIQRSEESASRAEQQARTIQAQIESRLRLMEQVDRRVARQERDEYENEQRILETICQGIRTPCIRLDAIGTIILSHRNPFTNEQKD